MKGEAVWISLECARTMSWVSVDDLLLVCGKVMIPHLFLPPVPFFRTY